MNWLHPPESSTFTTFADFDGFEYVCGGKLSLYWIASAKGELKLGNQTIRAATLVFYNLKRFSVYPRDPEMPSSEDRTLEDYEVTGGEGVLQFRFMFHGGMQIEIAAECVDLEVEHDD